MAEEQKRGPGRPRKEDSAPKTAEDFERRRNEAKQSGEEGINRFGEAATVSFEEQVWRQNEIDERPEDMRPGKMKDWATGEPNLDLRQSPGDLAKAANQMAGRAVFTQVLDPEKKLQEANEPTVLRDQRGAVDEGEDVIMIGSYRPMSEGSPTYRPGDVAKLPMKEAKRVVNLGVGRFAEERDDF